MMTIKTLLCLFLLLGQSCLLSLWADNAEIKTYPCGDALTYNATKSFSLKIDTNSFAPAYVDDINTCLAVDASKYKDKYAAVNAKFAGKTGLYDITLTTLAEIDGESTYRFLVDSVLIGTFQNPETSVDYKEITYTWKNVALSRKIVFQLEFNAHTNGKISEGNTTAYSRGRWKKLIFQPLCEGVPPCTLEDDIFQEEDGVLIMEAESALDFKAKGFSLDSGFTALGNGFLTYSGPAHTNHAGVATPANTLEYKFHISTPGTYRFVWRNSRDLNAPTFDAGNDSWLKIEADDFYAMKNALKIDCNDEDVFLKVWIQKSEFVNECWGEAYHARPTQNSVLIYATFDKVGEYCLKYGGRTPGHMVDRLMLFLDDPTHKALAFSSASPESQRGCPEEPSAIEEAVAPLLSTPQLFPNPTSGVFTINNAENITLVEVLDIDGRSLYEGIVVNNQVDISTLKKGVYLVCLTSKDGYSATSRILKK